MKTTLAWHFVGATLRDGRPVPADGEWLKHDGKVEMCSAGLHASAHIIDAIQYAPAGIVCRVALAGTIKHGTDKMVASRRVILWRLEATDDVFRAFARKAALSVIHLWDAPEIVKRYLETGDESIRAAARDAARDAAFQKFNDELEAMIREAADNPDDAALLLPLAKDVGRG